MKAIDRFLETVQWLVGRPSYRCIDVDFGSWGSKKKRALTVVIALFIIYFL